MSVTRQVGAASNTLILIVVLIHDPLTGCFSILFFDLAGFLNQVHAGLWLVCAWFLEFAFVRKVCVCVFVYVCMSAPKAI